MQLLSPLRARLASFDHAYALAIQLRRATGHDQFVIRTGDPIQPVRVTSLPPDEGDSLLTLVL
jgi:hypothetical protein